MNTTMLEDTEEDIKSTIWAACAVIASRCDGAVTEDGVGFNGSDTKFGFRVVEMHPSEMSDAVTWETYRMLAKYAGQLEKYGFIYDDLPVPPETGGDGRDEARQAERSREAALSRTITLEDDTFIVAFKYDGILVSAIRKIVGSEWSPGRKRWLVPIDAAGMLRTFSETHNFAVDTVTAEALSSQEAVAPEAFASTRTVTLEGRTLIFTFDYEGDVVDAVKAITGRRWDSKRKVWVVPATSAQQALGVAAVYDFDIDPEIEAQLQKKVADAVNRGVDSEAKEADLVVEGLATAHPDTGAALALRPFQKAGVRYALDTRRAFIADEMGLGKTVQALATVQAGGTYPALVVCPASLKHNWQREVRMWLPGKTTHIVDNQVGVKNADVVIINYDILSKQKDALIAGGFQSLIFDESHYAKNSAAARTKALKAIAASIPDKGMVLALTGTPVLNRPVELVAQLEILDRIEDFGGSWNFRKRYCNAKHNGWGWDFTGSSNVEELNTTLRQTCYVRRNKVDVLTELPEKERYTIEVDLSGPAIKEYRAAEADTLAYFSENGSGGGNAADHLAKITTLKRLAGEGKIDAACEWIDSFLDSTDRKLVVFAHHISVVDEIANRYGGLRVAGKDAMDKRQEAIDAFQNNDDSRVIVLNMKAGGVGLTLTAASDVLFVEQGWTPAEHDQAEDRCHRIGQSNNVAAWYMLADGTIDDDIYELIQKKRVVVDAVTDGDEAGQDSVLNDLVKTLIARTQ